MMPRWSLKQLCLGLVLLQVAFGIRLAAAQWWEARLPPLQKFGFGDSDGYWELGRTIARGEEYRYGDYRVFRTPGYPALLAPLFWISGGREPPTMWARGEGAIFGTLAILLVMLLTRTLFNERAAWIAGIIATFYPGQIAASIFVLSEAPFIPLMLGQLFAWVTAVRYGSTRGKIGYAILAGMLAGLATLVRPSWLLFTPFVLGLVAAYMLLNWGLARCGRRIPSPNGLSGKQHLAIGAVMMLALCVTMSPWWVRNYLVTGKIVPTSLQVGISLADGWNPEADGGSDLSKFEISVGPTVLVQTFPTDGNNLNVDGIPLIEFAGLLSEADTDKWYRERAILWAQRNPTRVLQLAGIKFLRMWNFIPNASDFASWKLRLIYAVSYTPVLICCLAGLWTFRQQGFAIWLMFLPAVYFTLLHMIFVASIRYQQPAIIAWLVLGAGWLATWQYPTSPTRQDATSPTRQRG